MRFLVRLPLMALLCSLAWMPLAIAQSPAERTRTALEAGRAADAVVALTSLADGDDAARLALGFARFAVAVEKLAAGLHKHGMKAPTNPFLPIVRLPLPSNPAPEALDYVKLRAIYQTFLDDLGSARVTLASVRSPESKLVLDLNAVRLNLGTKGPTVNMRDILAVLDRRQGRSEGAWEVAFDRADALWLQGYTHMLGALIEFVLAHDWRLTYDATAHLFFDGAKPARDLAENVPLDPRSMMSAVGGGIADQVAFLHLMQWPAGNKAQMAKVRGHLKSAIALSRETWAAVRAETDDDREWLPSPRQQSRAVPNLPITDETITGWFKVLDDVDALLDGRILLGHWRFNKGIDMRAFFDDPKPFDLMLWFTGHGAMPYLKDGPTLSGSTWQQWNRLFGNNFLGYAIFIN